MKHLFATLKQRIKSRSHTKEERRHALVGPANLWKMKRDFQIQFLRDMGLKPGVCQTSCHLHVLRS